VLVRKEDTAAKSLGAGEGVGLRERYVLRPWKRRRPSTRALHIRWWKRLQTRCVLCAAYCHKEKISVDRMLNEHYGQPWSLSAIELQLTDEKCEDHSHSHRA